MGAPLPANEPARLAALRRYAVLDMPPEVAFERLTRLAAQLFAVPIVLIALIDEDGQWFKFRVGLGLRETARELSFCAYAILADEVFVVPDARLDPHFAENPPVTGEPAIRFYAGAPLRTSEGFTIGTFCLIDTQPREFGAEQQALLSDLAAQAVDAIELRRAASAQQLQATYETMDCGVIVFSPGGEIVSANQAAQKVLGVRAGLLRGHKTVGPQSHLLREDGSPLPEMESPERLAAVTGLAQRAVTLGIQGPVGEPLWLQTDAVPVLGGDGRAVELISSFIDITKRQHAEAALRQSEARYRAVTQSANDAIIAADSQGFILFWNAGAQQLFGYTEAEIVGRPLHILMPERYRVAHETGFERYLTTGEAHVIGRVAELDGRRKNGSEFPLELSLATNCWAMWGSVWQAVCGQMTRSPASAAMNS